MRIDCKTMRARCTRIIRDISRRERCKLVAVAGVRGYSEAVSCTFLLSLSRWDAWWARFRNSHPTMLDLSPAFRTYVHSSENARFRNCLSAQQPKSGGTSGSGSEHIRGRGRPGAPPSTSRDTARHSEKPGRDGAAQPQNQQRLSPTEIHSSREARALPEIRWREWAPPSRPATRSGGT